MELIKDIIQNIKKDIRILDVSRTFTGQNVEKYLNNIEKRNDLVLFLYKNSDNAPYVEHINKTSDTLLLYKDKFVSIPKDIEKEKVVMIIRRMIDESDKLECCICFQDTDKMIPCYTCGISYCSQCLFEMNSTKCSVCKCDSLEYSF